MWMRKQPFEVGAVGVVIIVVGMCASIAAATELAFADAYVVSGSHGIGGYVRVADLNGDGLDDVVVMRSGAENGIAAMFSLGDGEFSEFVNLVPDIGWAELADIDGDGSTDLVFRGGDMVRVLFNDGTGRFPGNGVSIPFSDKLFSVIPGDYDGDGDVDVVASERIGAFGDYQTRRFLLRNDGAGGLIEPIQFSLEDGSRLTGVAVDVTGDDIDDLATLPGAFGDAVMRIFPGRADGTFGAPIETATCGGESEPRMAAADVNGDAWIDLVFTPGPGMRICVVLNEGGGAFGDPMSYDAGTRAADVEVCDFDLDGDVDIVVPGVSGLGGGDITVLLNDGNGRYPELREFVAHYTNGAPGGSGVAAGDFDADGRPDVAAPNYGPQLAVFLNSTARPGDADDDGDVDLEDFAAMFLCLSGPGGGVAPGCQNLDTNNDDDVDLADFATFQAMFED